MAVSLRILRGLLAAIPALADGEFYFATDTNALYIGDGGNVLLTPSSLPPSGSAGGDLTGTYPNPTIANNAVTLAKMATMATDSILGRATAATGNVEVLTALPFAFTGDVTRPADSNAQTIANSAVTYTKIQNVSATDKVLGRSTAGAGVVEEIACTAAGRALIDDADAAAQRTTLGLAYASQSQQETGTSNTVVVTPGVQHYHPSAAKGFVRYDGTGGPGIDVSYNVASITDTAVGNANVLWDTDFSSSIRNCSVATCGLAGARYYCDFAGAANVGSASTRVITANAAGTLTDCDVVCVVAFGDQ